MKIGIEIVIKTAHFRRIFGVFKGRLYSHNEDGIMWRIS